MAGYTDGCTMGDVLLGMKEKLSQTSKIPYLKTVRVKLGPWYFPPFDTYTIYLEPNGSPEEIIAEHGVVFAKYATHIVNVECIFPWRSPDDEDALVGRQRSNVGLTEFVADVLSYLENNMLGLSGLDPQYPPLIQAPDGAYHEVELEEGAHIPVCTLRYEARTNEFVRPIDT